MTEPHKLLFFFCLLFSCLPVLPGYGAEKVGMWMRFEQAFTSIRDYD